MSEAKPKPTDPKPTSCPHCGAEVTKPLTFDGQALRCCSSCGRDLDAKEPK